MILFTAGGALAEEYSRYFDSKIVSARRLNDDDLANHIRQASLVIHNSANVHCQNFDEAIADNFLLTKRILDIVHSVSKELPFIYISSMSILETEDTYKSTDDMTPYTFSKYLGEIYCLKHGHQPLSAARFSTIFYHNPSKDGLSRLIADASEKNEITIYNGGEAMRDFIPIEVAVKYLNKLASSPEMPVRINIASGEAVNFREVSITLREIFPGLTIHDKEMTGSQPILSSFSQMPLGKLGRIDFSLRDSIRAYAARLKG